MKKLQEVSLPLHKWNINISQVRDLRFLMGQRLWFFFREGNSELVWLNKRASNPAWIFLRTDVWDKTRAEQVVTFYPQGVSIKDVLVGERLLQCDSAWNIVLPESLKSISHDTSMRVVSFLLMRPFPSSCLWFAILGMPKSPKVQS